MHTEVNFSKIKKCGQLWDQMAACDGGRLCAACNNVVQDFRGMTKWNIAVVHAHSDKKVCGLYDKHHLENPSKRSTVKSNKKQLFLASALGVITTSSVSANLLKSNNLIQESTIQNQAKASQEAVALCKSQKPAQVDSLKIVRGRVTDGDTEYEPLIGCNIVILGTSEGTVADIDWSFMLDVTKAFEVKDSIVLDISYVGYVKHRKVIYKNDLNDKDEIYIDINLKADLEFEAFNINRKQRLHQKVWSSIKNIFRKEN